MDYDTLIREDARLIMLRVLAQEPSETLNSDLLRQHLIRFGIDRERAWVHVELDWLAEMGTVTLTEAGSVKVATLTERGGRHLSRAIAIEGIKRPARPGG